MKIYGINNYKEMPEDMIKDAAHAMQDDPENAFNNMLNIAKEFRDAGLTPVFLCDPGMENVLVTTKEKLLRKYH